MATFVCDALLHIQYSLMGLQAHGAFQIKGCTLRPDPKTDGNLLGLIQNNLPIPWKQCDFSMPAQLSSVQLTWSTPTWK